MTSPYQPPDVTQHVPPTMLAYASARGSQPIPLSPEYVHLLNQADEFRAGARLLRISGVWDLVWGVPIALAGFFLIAVTMSGMAAGGAGLPIWVGIAAAALGSILLASGVWLMFFPTPAAMITDGVSLILLALVNGTWYALDRMRGDRPSWIWIAVFVICLFSGIGRFRRYGKFRAASQTAPPNQTLKWLDELRKGLRKVKPEQDVTRSTFRFESTNAWPPVMCRGRMTPAMLLCLINSENVRFYRKGELRIEPVADKKGREFVPPADAAKKVKAKITLGERTFNALIPYESLARLEGWQAAPVAPAPTATGAEPASDPASEHRS